MTDIQSRQVIPGIALFLLQRHLQGSCKRSRRSRFQSTTPPRREDSQKRSFSKTRFTAWFNKKTVNINHLRNYCKTSTMLTTSQTTIQLPRQRKHSNIRFLSQCMTASLIQSKPNPTSENEILTTVRRLTATQTVNYK